MKLAVVGGGSTYTPELVDGVARLADDVKVTELVLVDPDQARLDVVGPVSARIMRRYGHPARLRWTASLETTKRFAHVAPLATLRIVDIPPVAGAALLGLDHIGAPPGARARLRDAYLAQPAPP